MKRLVWMFGGDLIVETDESGMSAFTWFARVVDFELGSQPVEEWRQRLLDQIDADHVELMDAIQRRRATGYLTALAKDVARSVLKRTVQ